MGRLKAWVDRKFRSLIDINDLTQYMTDYPSMAGEPVNPEMAHRLFAVYACVNVLAETLATLPPKLYRNLPDGSKEEADDHPFAKVLRKPDPTDTTFDFLERIVWHLCLRGKFFAVKVKVFGQVRMLLPVSNPDTVGITETDDHRYRFTIGGQAYDQDDVFFLIMHDGKSVIRYQADTFGRNAAINRYASSYFRNYARPDMVISTAQSLDDKKVARFRERWQETYGGAKNAHKVAILDNGMEAKSLSITNEDSQFLETNKYSDSQIAGLFRVPVYMIGNFDKATFSNIENLGQQFSRFTMLPWCRRIEEAFTGQCLPEPDVYCEFLMDGLERGNLLSRYQAYSVGMNGGFLNANEIRRKENMNPYPGGDDYWKPKNTGSAGEETEQT